MFSAVELDVGSYHVRVTIEKSGKGISQGSVESWLVPKRLESMRRPYRCAAPAVFHAK